MVMKKLGLWCSVAMLVIWSSATPAMAEIEYRFSEGVKPRFADEVKPIFADEIKPTSPAQEITPVKIETTKPQITLKLGQKSAVINGKSVALDTPPILVHGTTLVPIRFVSESLGAKVTWNKLTSSVTIVMDENIIELQIGNSQALVNGEPAHLQEPPTIKDGSTIVPLRFVSESLGQKIDYNNSTQEIGINQSVNHSTVSTGTKENSSKDINAFIGSYSLFIPGGAYTTDNYATNTRTDTIFLGSSVGSLKINSDGTFQFSNSTSNWNRSTSAYDAGKGTWSKTGDDDYPILLNDSKTGKQFKIGESLPKDGGDIYVWEVGGTWEIGTKE